jgi:PAS domain S-box-containing protein
MLFSAIRVARDPMMRTKSRTSDRPKQPDVSNWAGWILLILSVIVLTGYAFRLVALERFVPESVEMKANSALAMMLAGVALLRRKHFELPIYSVSVSLIGALTLWEYFWNVNLGIDELLIHDAHYFFYPGRISQHTSIGFVLLGVSLLPMNAPYRIARELSRVSGLMTGAVGALAIVSHAYDTHAANLIAPQNNVSVPTAICFFVGAIGVLYANPSEGIIRLLHADNAGGAMLRRLLPVGFLVSLYVGFAVTNAQMQLRWEPGFSIALAAGGVGICLFTGIILTAASLERQDLARGESERRFRLAAQTAPVMIWMSGPDKLCTYFNEAWLTFRGRTMEAEAGNGWTEGVHRDDLNRCIATYVESFDRHEQFQMQYRLRRYDGEFRWIVDTGVPRFDEAGSFAGFIGSCIDITDRKLSEEAVADLERRILSAQEEERERIARELHDDINQRIATLVWAIGGMGRRQSGEERRSRESFDRVTEQLSQIATDIQSISHRLHSTHLEYLGLAAAVEDFCGELRKQHHVEIDLTCDRIPRNLPKEISLNLYRVLQEALQNAMKHSGVERFRVELVADTSDVRLTVSDEGKGFKLQDKRKGQGLGLISMRERMRLVHGQFAVKSEPGHGTTINCRVPIGNYPPEEEIEIPA